VASTCRHTVTFEERYPGSGAGAAIGSLGNSLPSHAETQRQLNPDGGNIWAPFQSKLDWSIAYWAKLRGPSSSALNELFAIEEVSYLFYF
jgi:hypothetical protein